MIQLNKRGQTGDCIIDGLHGAHIPEIFCKSYVLNEPHLDDDVTYIVENGVNADYVQECWERILQDGTITGISGKVYRLQQEQDLFAVEIE